MIKAVSIRRIGAYFFRISFVSSALVLYTPPKVFADDDPDFRYFRQFAFEGLTLVDVLLGLVVTLALLALFWGIALMIFRAGDETARAQGKQVIIWGVIGLFVVFTVWGLIALLQQIFNVDPDADVNAPPTVDGLI